MVLLTTQIALIRTRRPHVHMKLGIVAVALIPLMAVSGFFADFFSSRRRHTRSKRDWSSDVCSSDLGPDSREAYAVNVTSEGAEIRANSSAGLFYGVQTLLQLVEGSGAEAAFPEAEIRDWPSQIGRASCRERVKS